MAEKTFFEELQEQAKIEESKATERGPELGVGPHTFTIIGGTSGVKEETGNAWSCIVARHTNGHEYRLFYSLYWPLKDGELEPNLNVDAFHWITGFDPVALSTYKDKDFDNYFNGLTGKQFEIRYTTFRSGRVGIDYKATPVLLDSLEEVLEVDEIDFDSIE
jgi:hypothetical protein